MEKIKLSKEEKIVNYLEENGIKASWLANKLGVTSTHLHFILKGNKRTKRDLTLENLKIINEALKTSF